MFILFGSGYDGVTDFLEILADLIVEEVEQVKALPSSSLSCYASIEDAESKQKTCASDAFQQPLLTETLVNGKHNCDLQVHLVEVDSGIDTSDSCDEKKKKDIKSQPKQIRRPHVRTSSPKETAVAIQHQKQS